MSFTGYTLKTAMSLSNMIREMSRKKLELKRISKTTSLLLLSGLSTNSVPQGITERCLDEINDDGGWSAIVDTMWNALLLRTIDAKKFHEPIENALSFIVSQINKDGLWGRSKRDMSRIPVTGLLLYLFPELASPDILERLEKLWQMEKNSLTYKAAYTLMAFKRCEYVPRNKELIEETLYWLGNSAEKDGGFAPWKYHPAGSDVYCTAIALTGLMQYPNKVPSRVFYNGFSYLVDTRLETGIWPYHEIEDGASWGLYAITQLLRKGLIRENNG